MSEGAARLLVQTVNELSRRAPAVVAAAAREMAGITLGLHFGDGTHAELRSDQGRLIASGVRPESPHVEAYFDDRAMRLLFDFERKPVDQLFEGSLDVRGERPLVLAVWRTFKLLAQRASGLRSVQILWREYRGRFPAFWTTALSAAASAGANGSLVTSLPRPADTGWAALDYLDHRHPEETDQLPSMVGGMLVSKTRALWDGRKSVPWWEFDSAFDSDLLETMLLCKARVREEISAIIPDREPKAELYNLIREYPQREGKGLRPTLTIASCCALGGRSEDAVRAAAAIELFHNGFLVHDDIADESTHRRNETTLHTAHGVGLAVNAGDAMNLMAVDAVLSNLATLGLGRTLGLIHEIMHMCRETVEGQAIELGWIRNAIVPERVEDYFAMSTKKTGWYTCISPCRSGAVCAGETNPERLDRFNEAFRLIGIAFQIQDDVLNLQGEEALYGKERLGDLLEGKRTVMMIHLFSVADPLSKRRLHEICRRPRMEKTQDDAEELLDAMLQFGSIEYAMELANRLAHEGVRRFEEDLTFIPETEAKGVLRQIANYVTTRQL
ncbi:MAG: polyprenyl synthetase family protein [Bryobacteraceae bacterium]